MVSKKKEKTTCENIEKTFINETLNTHTSITIDRANILGKPKVTGNRPVVNKMPQLQRAGSQASNVRKVRHTTRWTSRCQRSANKSRATKTPRNEISAIYDKERAAGCAVTWSGSRLLVRNDTNGNFREITN